MDIVGAIGHIELLHPHQFRTQPPKEGQVQAQPHKQASESRLRLELPFALITNLMRLP